MAIDGIDCDVLFEVKASHMHNGLPIEIEFTISAKNIEYTCLDGCLWRYHRRGSYCFETKESISKVLKEMIDDINLLKFDRRSCSFRTQEEINETTCLIAMFLSSDNSEMNLDKCCVCYEETSVLTSCNHHICIPCADKVLVSDDTDDEIVNEESSEDFNKRKCPICREGNISEMPLLFSY